MTTTTRSCGHLEHACCNGPDCQCPAHQLKRERTAITNNPIDNSPDRRKTTILRRRDGETLTDYTLRFLLVHLPEAVVRRPEPRKLTVEEQCEDMIKELLRDNVTDRRRSDRE